MSLSRLWQYLVGAPFWLHDGFGAGLMIAHKREEPDGTHT